jgi:hypothetical protein
MSFRCSIFNESRDRMTLKDVIIDDDAAVAVEDFAARAPIGAT